MQFFERPTEGKEEEAERKEARERKREQGRKQASVRWFTPQRAAVPWDAP